jgi:Leucine-rich repeat (LRR) protein
MPPLAGLSDLSLANTDVADLSPLPRVAPNLSVLSVARNVIRDLDPLASLSRIERLNVSSNQIGSLAPLAKLARLRVLEFIPIPETRSA